SALIGGVTLSASGTCPKLIVNGARLHNTMVRTGANPAGNSVLYVKKGSVNRLYAAGHAQQKTVVGDVTVLVEGGTFKSFVRLLSEVTLKGDLRVSLKNMDLTKNDEATDGRMIQMLFHSGAIHGDLSVELENVKADQYYGGFSSATLTLTGDAVTTAKNCEFKKFFYGGLGKSIIYGNVENTLENVTTDHFNGAGDCTMLGKQDGYTGKKDSVGNLTNRLKNVTFTETAASASIHLGNVNGTQSGSIFNTLEGVFVPQNHTVYCGNRGGSAKSVVNTVKDSTFSSTFCGGGSGGTVTDLTNTITDSTFHNYLYLAGGGNTVKGQIENRLKNCDVTKYYTFGGVNGGKVLNSHLEYGVKNYVEGGSFHGFWGGSASSTATHRGNLYTEISSGDFYGYDSSRPNSFSGGCRNTRHEGNAVSLIRGGTFHEYVVGGSIPNSEAYKNDHVGSATLTLAGGTFKNSIYPNCLWGSYPEAELNLDNTYALEPYSFALAVECDTFVAGSSDPTSLSFPLTCKNLIARGSGPLRHYSKVLCESFVAEENAPSPELYGELTCTTLNAGDKPLILGAKSRIK
ncbi:MAG: hypothetical protein J6W31_05115, partial [Clostridia bacterium]|nr:hypothetical protein [Clostridia bacterium]